MHYAQQEFSVRLQWGLAAAQQLSRLADHCVIVDVLSFSTCVDIACGRGAQVLPYLHKDDSAKAFAEERGAQLAGSRGRGGLSLSPASLQGLPAGSRLVLPSPNGAAISLASEAPQTLAGCLRNADAVAARLNRQGGSVLLIAAGELGPDGLLRFAYEDFIGAGAIIQRLAGGKSLEALAAEAAFTLARYDLERQLAQGMSGCELSQSGFAGDVELAAQLNASGCVPVLREGAFQALGPGAG